MAKKRNYRKEYDNYQGKPEQIAKRGSRNKARALLAKEGLVHKGDGKDVDHKDTNALNDSRKNLRVQTKHENRSYPRTKGARKKKK